MKLVKHMAKIIISLGIFVGKASCTDTTSPSCESNPASEVAIDPANEVKATTSGASSEAAIDPANEVKATTSEVNFTLEDIIITDKRFVNLILDPRMVSFFKTWGKAITWESEEIKKEVYQLLIMTELDTKLYLPWFVISPLPFPYEDIQTFLTEWEKTYEDNKDDENYGDFISIKWATFVKTPVDGIKFLAEKLKYDGLYLDHVTGFDLNVLNSKRIEKLRVLDIRRCNVSSFVFMDQLVDLRRYDLSFNNISTLECESQNAMENLMILNLDGNPIRYKFKSVTDITTVISKKKELVIHMGEGYDSEASESESDSDSEASKSESDSK